MFGQQVARVLHAAVQSVPPLPPPLPPLPPLPVAPQGPLEQVPVQLHFPLLSVQDPEPVPDPTLPEQLRSLPPKLIELPLTEPL